MVSLEPFLVSKYQSGPNPPNLLCPVSGVQSSAVLEDGLRQMCRDNTIEVKNGDDISSLNQKLGSNSIYTRTMQKQIQAWKAIRDNADHGKFDQYEKEAVKDMLRGVKRFLREYLK